ncbi:uncharacterized protein LOC126572881 [Anopheles aquasalis]|uniref:uncharacterized protein LOC126572881 n=1 Tax=Anopheles aquasalis TaxID=42839 RepID=UPI00215A1965|nr:uncharacterized protein LOC126572881 [Anopheles aquasalis]
MKTQIKHILNIDQENSTLDNYLLSLFNMENLNPTYVFLLPMDGKNHVRKLIYQRSDFEEADFPNITTVNKFTGRTPNRTTPATKPGGDMVLEKKIFEYIDKDTMDEGTLKVVEENVRTERNFIKFMDDLNRDLEDEERRRMTKESVRKSASSAPLFTPYIQKYTQSVGWEDLGLDGWAGGLREIQGHRFDHPVQEKSRPTAPTKASLPSNYQPVHQTMTPRPPSLKPSVNGILNQTALTNAAGRYKQTGVLLSEQVGAKLQEIYKRTNSSNARIKWPITNSRDAHRDEDVFIARANNPFGHSTKWRWSNETDQEDPLKAEVQPSREGRSKRGVYNLYSMIKCATGCDPIIYKGYGCYCGFLGSGQALDGIDRCCKMHDYCYSTANCPMFLEYFVPYLWKCYRGRPLCAIDHGEWGGPGSCASRLCHCDLSLSKCLRRYYCPRKRNVCTTSPLRLLQNLVMVF